MLHRSADEVETSVISGITGDPLDADRGADLSSPVGGRTPGALRGRFRGGGGREEGQGDELDHRRGPARRSGEMIHGSTLSKSMQRPAELPSSSAQKDEVCDTRAFYRPASLGVGGQPDLPHQDRKDA